MWSLCLLGPGVYQLDGQVEALAPLALASVCRECARASSSFSVSLESRELWWPVLSFSRAVALLSKFACLHDSL